MLLRKLEAYGFKSFADKTEVDFGPGITVVVGPNGSGKSNISDAIRWVLGEQNIRNLRGAKAEDIIFSGSTARRPLGVAEVSLVFDNTNGILPLDFNEVTITRRVFRSGESEYFINKAHCRLKDIHDLLADTGLGREAMPVIGQNKVDEILNSKPEERRMIFEDAAGITKYKNRKKEALRKLTDTEQNLVRLQDIIAEIETQLGPLAESAAKTTRYNELYSELTICRITVLVDKLTQAEKMVESATLQELTLQEEEVGLSAQLALGETEIERLTGQLASLDQAISSAEAIVQQNQTELERLDGKMALLDERINQGKLNDERIRQELLQITEQKQELEAKLLHTRTLLQEKEKQALILDTELVRKKAEYQNILDKIQRLETELEVGKEKTLDHLQELAGQRNQKSSIERDMARLLTYQSDFARELENYDIQSIQVKQQAEKNQTEVEEIKTRLDDWHTEAGQLNRERLELEETISRLMSQDKQNHSKLQEAVSRHKILINMQREFEGFGRGIKSILYAEAPWKAGLCGAVAQIIHVPQQYITAVETALGGALQHIVTQDETTAKQAIEFLKTQKLGRATFLPLSTIQPSRPRDYEIQAAKQTGGLGFAAEIVTCSDEYRKVVEFLLGRTVLAEDIDAALRIARECAFRIKMVTLDGQQVNPGGSLTGGSTQRRENSFLSRGNEIERLEQEIQKIRQALADTQAQLAAANAALEQNTGKVTAMREKRQACEVRLAELAVYADNLHGEQERLRLAMEALKTDMKSSDEEKKALGNRLIECTERITMLENRDFEHKQQVADWQQQLKQLHETRETMNNAVTDVKIAMTGLQQEINTLQITCSQAETDQELQHRKIHQLAEEVEAIRTQISDYTQELENIKAARADKARQRIEQTEVRAARQTDKLTVLAELQKQEKTVRDMRKQLNEVQGKLHEIQLMATKYKYEFEHCHKQLEEQGKMSLEEAKSVCRPGPAAEFAVKIQDLEQEITALGPVNFAAIEEYTRIQERYEFLQKQSQDLQVAKEYLATIIADIDKTMSKQFNTAFRQINEHFGETFQRLFGGGKAHLALMEPDNLLETGIDIFVQPPGKKQQNLALLSGGERALTVIALLFAFLAYRPAPFTMVDEIDAPLDEANLGRFSSFLKDYARNTQFIVVTHRKGTMEAADIIHGVTMEESGVSRLVSVKFSDVAG
ncbi:chromosome segregation protein SMC [Propionispora sp. 2/2-37]|uniref:chromosome segregation protein SMC n=1 Tax=Propionispora sp. 2/2-37 TaxID=1677858 RepID=UPI0006BB65C3|nr:chromosome segregation protein SMC [Propionispora sp. 2/2-37]